MTDNPKPHLRAAMYASIVSMLFLILLFIFPHMQVCRLEEKLIPLSEAVTAAVLAQDWENALNLCSQMNDVFLPYDKPMRLYLNHVDVDQLRTRLLSCMNLAKAEDDQIIVDLEEAKSKLLFFKNIETFTVWNLF